jgi:hypothetical protein
LRFSPLDPAPSVHRRPQLISVTPP